MSSSCFPLHDQENVFSMLDNTLGAVTALQSIGDDNGQAPEWNAEMAAKAVSLHTRVSAALEEISQSFKKTDDMAELYKLKNDVIKTVEADVSARLSKFKTR